MPQDLAPATPPPAAPAIAPALALSAARHAISVLVGILILKGWVDDTWAPFVISGLLALVVAGWSIFQHTAAYAKFQTALAWIPPDVLQEAVAQANRAEHHGINLKP